MAEMLTTIICEQLRWSAPRCYVQFAMVQVIIVIKVVFVKSSTTSIKSLNKWTKITNLRCAEVYVIEDKQIQYFRGKDFSLPCRWLFHKRIVLCTSFLSIIQTDCFRYPHTNCISALNTFFTRHQYGYHTRFFVRFFFSTRNLTSASRQLYHTIIFSMCTDAHNGMCMQTVTEVHQMPKPPSTPQLRGT